MRVLAIETASEACSVALFQQDADGLRLLANDHRVLGRGHAEQLVPMIAGLPDRGRAETIRVSLGPGSFTGVRIGIAAARALGLAWGARVMGYPTLALLARQGLVDHCGDALVCVNGGHGEWFVQPFDGNGNPAAPVRSMVPQDAVKAHAQHLVIGSTAQDFVGMRASGTAVPALPDARMVADLAECHLTTDLSPLYGRAPDARLPGIRP